MEKDLVINHTCRCRENEHSRNYCYFGVYHTPASLEPLETRFLFLSTGSCNIRPLADMWAITSVKQLFKPVIICLFIVTIPKKTRDNC
ncbi:hypothetical protein KUTeg_001398 [Tegillarca granosa]|uniref:Uncharacterized protein n=1 Tax=Tegillarca granosa TaxID=220873 RepID=A0ABQ9FUK1_TEGGR|nr:hypothetical protein KUTeg_001398 [Tegillarca granosa]